MNEKAFPDRLSLVDMRFTGRHGAVEGEQEDPQAFEVDVILHANLSLAAQGDELSATVDYRVVAELARAVVEGPSVTLIETLAGDIAADILFATEASVVDAVEVSVRKPEAALGVELETVEVTLLRQRTSEAGARPSRRAARPG
jgi:dihydroneopterin aldolase